jgi:hypothetical protein
MIRDAKLGDRRDPDGDGESEEEAAHFRDAGWRLHGRSFQIVIRTRSQRYMRAGGPRHPIKLN